MSTTSSPQPNPPSNQSPVWKKPAILDSVDGWLHGVYRFIGQFVLTTLAVIAWPEQLWRDVNQHESGASGDSARYLPALLYYWAALVLMALALASIVAATSTQIGHLDDPYSSFVFSFPKLVMEGKVTSLILLLLPWILFLGLYAWILTIASRWCASPLAFDHSLEASAWCAGCAVTMFSVLTPLAAASILSGGHGLVITPGQPANISDKAFGVTVGFVVLWLLLSHIRIVRRACRHGWVRSCAIVASSLFLAWLAGSTTIWYLHPIFRAWLMYSVESVGNG